MSLPVFTIWGKNALMRVAVALSKMWHVCVKCKNPESKWKSSRSQQIPTPVFSVQRNKWKEIRNVQAQILALERANSML